MSDAETKTSLYRGEPTHAQVMRRPKWLLALLAIMAVAAIFAALAQWQLGAAIQRSLENSADTETAVPLATVNAVSEPVDDIAAGHRVAFSGSFVEGDFQVISERVNGGVKGYWVVGHIAVSDAGEKDQAALETASVPASIDNPHHMAASLGWAASLEEAQQAVAALNKDTAVQKAVAANKEYIARYNPTEQPKKPLPATDQTVLETMVPAQLLNLWQEEPAGQVYAGFAVPEIDTAVLDAVGLEQIDSFAPMPQEQINWVNLFYAVEWVIFALFAFYFWWRLTRDAWEKEHELKLLKAEGGN